MITRLTLLPRLVVACLTCALLVSTTAVAQDYKLPSLGQPADTYMSPAEEHKLGAQVVAQLLERGMIIEDAQLSDYLRYIGTRLAKHTSRDPGNFQFYLIDNQQVNAFALPGGYIGVNAGLITETDDESELAGVMAHEIAHVTQRHIARQVEATAGMGWATAAAMLVAVIAGGGDPDAVSAAVTAGLSNLGQQQINFTRAHEFEADRVGIHTLAESDFDPNAMASFFEKMQRRSRLYGDQLPQILLTHPVSNTRMAEAEARAKDYPAPQVHESSAYPLMRERARVLASKQLSDLTDYYRQHGAGGADAAPAIDYGYAITLIRQGRNDEASALLEPLAEAHPDQPAYALALAESRSRAGDLTAARQRLDDLNKRFPDSRAVKLAYAEVLADGGDTQALRNYLLPQTNLLDHSPEAQKLLAEAAGRENNLGEAYYRQARYYALRGDYARGINQLRTALQTADLNAFDKARLRALREQLLNRCQDIYSERECEQQLREDSSRPG